MTDILHPVGEQSVLANGVDATTGGYLLPPVSPETVCAVAEGRPLDPVELSTLQSVYRPEGNRYLGVTFGVDPSDLASAGWGVVFASDGAADVRQALRPLLEHRAAQAGRLYRELSGTDGYRLGESDLDFLARFGTSPGPVDPENLPFYLLLVGDPETIPFAFQQQLDLYHAVGRVCFDSVAEYEAYARGVVAAESGAVARRRALGFFAPSIPGDVATRRSAHLLVETLADRLRGRHTDWSVEACVGERATKAALKGLLANAPAFLFGAAHGVGFPCGHALQRAHQGALLCQDWPGPLSGQTRIPAEQYFSGADVDEDVTPAGSIAFLFACYGAGTPQRDEFALGQPAEAARIAPAPFVARLPQKLLASGALAVVGHVDRAWGWSFTWPRVGAQVEVFRAMAECVMAGQPLGAAMEYFNEKYAALSAELTDALTMRACGKRNDVEVAGLWTARTDARNYVILGDPAVRVHAR